MSDHLFARYDLHGVLEHQRKKMLAAIDAHAAAEIKSRDLDSLVAHFVSEFKADVPELTEGAISVEIEEIQVDVSGDWNRAIIDPSVPHYVPGMAVTYYVPFRGDRTLFECHPSTFTTTFPYARLRDRGLEFRFERADTNVAATKQAFESELSEIRKYLQWVASDVERFNAEIPGQARTALDRRQKRIREMETGTQALGLPVRRAPASESARMPVTKTATAEERHYDLALSFAGEDRAYVEEVATLLTKAEVSVFYDKFEKALLWGKNLVDHLAEIYQHRSRYVVMFISEHYVSKAWPRHERTHAQARALMAKEEYILPARFDDTEVPGLAGTVGYVDLRGMAPDAFVALVLTKLGRR